MNDFDSLSRGDQFLVLLRRDAERRARDAQLLSSLISEGLEKYLFTASQWDAEVKALQMHIQDLIVAEQDLKLYTKGAENENPILTVQPSTESLKQFSGITCTTV